jgi:hypothetical protein
MDTMKWKEKTRVFDRVDMLISKINFKKYIYINIFTNNKYLKNNFYHFLK